jgi:hypothetical protein
MSEDDTGRPNAPTRTPHPSKDPHPSWCEPDECTIEPFHPYGYHGSYMHTVKPDNNVRTIIYLCAIQVPGRVHPPMAMLEISDERRDGEGTETYPLTPAQVRRLHEITGELLTALATDEVTGCYPGTPKI